ncbi:MAG TPA: hypothetical protein VI316_12330, partial [Candidatus Dormibacteraeota bacterium]
MKVFASWGRFVFRRRWWVLSGSMVMVVIASAALSLGGHLRENQRVPTEAGQAGDLIDSELNQGPPSSDFGLVFRSTRLSAASPAFRTAMLQALAPLQHDAHVTRIATPYTSPANPDPRLISRDQHSAVADVVIGDSFDNAKAYYPALRALVHSDVLTIEAAGGLAIDHDYNQLLNDGL